MAFKAIHGMTKTPEHRSWREMLARCYNPKNDRYHRYGGRGITVCSRWKESFVTFYEDMGPRPEGTTIDRKNNDGDYSPENCRWATAIEQQANTSQSKRCRISGVEYETIGAACRDLGIHRATMQWRINHKVSGYEVLL